MLTTVFGTTMIVALVIVDWIWFTQLNAAAARYGCRVARHEDVLPLSPTAALSRFDDSGVLALRHGVAKYFAPTQEIVLRPQYRLLSHRFRTAWPLKGTIELKPSEAATRLVFTKRMPWSSAIITLLWFGLVSVGTLTFLVAFLITGGLGSLSGLLLGLGVMGMGLLVLAFGIVIVAVAYRLEDTRLRQAYDDLRAALHTDPTATSRHGEIS